MSDPVRNTKLYRTQYEDARKLFEENNDQNAASQLHYTTSLISIFHLTM